jgi:competence protein ComGC
MMEAHTLLELLLVIAMLGILYSMYLGTLSRAREAADRAMCKQYQWEFKTIRETEDIYETLNVVNRCYGCHATEP